MLYYQILWVCAYLYSIQVLREEGEDKEEEGKIKRIYTSRPEHGVAETFFLASSQNHLVAGIFFISSFN
jgi:hypothetical protein